jgi:hypothetical protein
MYQVIILTGLPSDIPPDTAFIPALGAYKCAHALRNNGFSCLVVNHLPQYSIAEINELLDHAVSDDTLMIGISSTFLTSDGYSKEIGSQFIVETKEYQLNNTMMDKFRTNDSVSFDENVLDRLRNKFPKLKFVLGGIKINTEYQINGLDFMCVGYSEVSIVNIARHLLTGDIIPDSRKNVFGTVIVDDPTAKLYKFHNEVMDWLPEDVVTHTRLPLEISRGCIFNCKFCSYPMRGKKKFDYFKYADNLRKELVNNYEKYSITHYSIIDDTFNDNKEKLIAIRDMVRTLPFQPNFWCFARLDLLGISPETIDILYEIGCKILHHGIETLDHNAGKAIGKGYTKEKLINTAKIIKQKHPDMFLHGSFIIGLPGESIASIRETNRLLHSKEFPLDSWEFIPLKMWHANSANGKNASWATVWMSEFDKNWQQYYQEVDNPPNNIRIYWKNKEMNIFEATALSSEFLKKYAPIEYVARSWGEHEPASIFIPKYKQKLLEIVKTKKRGISSVVERNVANV